MYEIFMFKVQNGGSAGSDLGVTVACGIKWHLMFVYAIWIKSDQFYLQKRSRNEISQQKAAFAFDEF